MNADREIRRDSYIRCEDTRTYLRAHRARQLQARLIAGSRWRDTAHVFTTSIGTPMDVSRVSKQFRRALAKAGLPHKRFHDRATVEKCPISMPVAVNLAVKPTGSGRMLRLSARK
jgi:hypothetical protein